MKEEEDEKDEEEEGIEIERQGEGKRPPKIPEKKETSSKETLVRDGVKHITLGDTVRRVIK